MIRDWVQQLSWRQMRRLRRAMTAIAFYRGRMSEDQAYSLMRAANQRLGSWPLISIDADGVLERLLDRYVDQPEFPSIAAEAAERIYSKWPGDDSDFTSSIFNWAYDVAIEYAERDGVPLLPLDVDTEAA